MPDLLYMATPCSPTILHLSLFNCHDPMYRNLLYSKTYNNANIQYLIMSDRIKQKFRYRQNII